MSYNLKPCPFCGDDKPFLVHNEASYMFFIACHKCSCFGPLCPGEASAIEWWNSRAMIENKSRSIHQQRLKEAELEKETKIDDSTKLKMLNAQINKALSSHAKRTHTNIPDPDPFDFSM